MTTIARARRYYLLKRQVAAASREPISSIWQAKQEEEPGTALPADFPSLIALRRAGYTTVEDIDGADANELRQAGVGDAEAVLAAVALL